MKEGFPLIGFYNYSVILTYVGLASAIMGMVQALEGEPRMAVIHLLICGFCDMFDGTIARMCKRSEDAKCFGMQIDSLCDLVCFGVFPAMLGYAMAPTNWFTIGCMIFYVLAAVIRLAYFNVQETNRMAENAGKREYYLGMPVTTSALFIPMVALATTVRHLHWDYLVPTALLILGVAFISRFKVKKPYIRGLAVLAIIGLIVVALVILYGGKMTCMKYSTALA